MLAGNITPAVLGNIIGGGLLVALLFYGQVRSDKSDASRASPGSHQRILHGRS
jgi:formate/nitrite transporter FocA (FNT family)